MGGARVFVFLPCLLSERVWRVVSGSDGFPFAHTKPNGHMVELYAAGLVFIKRIQNVDTYLRCRLVASWSQS